jgi:RNA polymerase sigma-70 factor (ECF subfamily)
MGEDEGPLDLEAGLIERAKRGDLRAYAVLVKRHEERMFRTAWRILHQREDAEDCVQETFLKAWEGLPRLKDIHAFRRWLYQILANLALDILRKRERGEKRLDSYQSEVVSLARFGGSENPREALRRAQEAERIEKAIENLAPRQKVVFVLRHFQGLKLAEIAEVLEAPLGTIKATLHAALAKLQRDLCQRAESHGLHRGLLK